MELAPLSVRFGRFVLYRMLRDWDSPDLHQAHNQGPKESFSLTPPVANSGALVEVWFARLRNNAASGRESQ
jgi:hypothetical protein